MDKRLIFSLILLSFCACEVAAEPVVVVVRADSRVTTLEKSEIIDIFMGRFVAYPDGSAATPLDVGARDDLKQDFYQKLVGLSLSKVNAYWSRLKFSGRQKATLEKQSVEEVLAYIESDPKAIGYIYKSKLTPSLKVILELDD